MKIPIPSDWDHETFDCFQIQWPQSPQWLGILAGLLTSVARGRFWDERTGSIIDVQQIGELIDVLNIPFVDCEGLVNPVQMDGETYGQFVSAEESDFIMSLCGYNPKAFKVENGVLYVRDFCGEWVEIGGVGGIGGGSEPSVVLPDDIDYDETDISQCGMARGVADKMKQLADYIWANADDLQAVVMPIFAQNAVGMTLDAAHVSAATQQALIMKGSVIISYGLLDLEHDDVVPPTIADELACAILPLMSPDGSVDSSTLYNAVKDFFNGKFSGLLNLNNVFIKNYWTEIRLCFGEGRISDLAIGGVFDSLADCDCGTGSWDEPVYAGSVRFTGEVEQDANSSAIVTSVENNGKRLKISWTAPEGAFVGSGDHTNFGIEFDGPTDTITFESKPLGGSLMPTFNWQEITTCAEISPVLWAKPVCSAWPNTVTVEEPNVQICVNAPTGGDSTSEWVEYNMKKCPSTPSSGARTYTLQIEIVAIDGVSV